MRTNLLVLAAFTIITTSVSPQPPTNPRDHRTKPDLNVVSLFTAGEVVQIGIVNRGGDGNNHSSRVRVKMYRMIRGREELVSTAYANIPAIPKGSSKTVSVRFPGTTANSRIVGELDYANQLIESDESNNRFQRTVK